MGIKRNANTEPPLYPPELVEPMIQRNFKNYKPIDPDAREQHMIGLAVDLAEKKLIDGTASSQIIQHYLRLATAKANLELEMTKQQSKLIEAKTAAIQSDMENDQNYAEVLRAMRSYTGVEEYDIPWP